MENENLTRQELYHLVWSTPMTTLAKKYLISDVGLRKICVKLNIPLPKAGCWERERAGQSITKTPLSKKYSGEEFVTLKFRKEDDEIVNEFHSNLNVLEKEIHTKLKDLLIVPDKLTRPDSLIISAKKTLLSQRPTIYNHWLAHTYLGELHIRVSPKNVMRSLRFMNTLIKLMRARGHKIIVEPHSCDLVIFGEKINFNLREKLKRIPTTEKYRSSEYIPTGLLSFNARLSLDNMQWIDGKLAIETQLAKIVAKLEIKVNALIKKHLQWELEHQAEEEKQRIIDEYEKKKEKELVEFKDLLLDAKRWHKSMVLRNYIADLERNANNLNKISEELNNRFDWARKKADWYDPQIEAEDNLLDGIDRNTLAPIKKKYEY